LSPGWNHLYLPINALILLGMINPGITLIRPDWIRFHWLMSILGGVGNLIVAYFLIFRGNPVVMASLGKTPDAQRVAQIVNQTIYYLHLVRRRHPHPAARERCPAAHCQPAYRHPSPGHTCSMSMPIGANFSFRSGKDAQESLAAPQHLRPLAPQLFFRPVVPAYYRCYLEP